MIKLTLCAETWNYANLGKFFCQAAVNRFSTVYSNIFNFIDFNEIKVSMDYIQIFNYFTLTLTLPEIYEWLLY